MENIQVFTSTLPPAEGQTHEVVGLRVKLPLAETLLLLVGRFTHLQAIKKSLPNRPHPPPRKPPTCGRVVVASNFPEELCGEEEHMQPFRPLHLYQGFLAFLFLFRRLTLPVATTSLLVDCVGA